MAAGREEDAPEARWVAQGCRAERGSAEVVQPRPKEVAGVSAAVLRRATGASRGLAAAPRCRPARAGHLRLRRARRCAQRRRRAEGVPRSAVVSLRWGSHPPRPPRRSIHATGDGHTTCFSPGSGSGPPCPEWEPKVAAGFMPRPERMHADGAGNGEAANRKPQRMGLTVSTTRTIGVRGLRVRLGPTEGICLARPEAGSAAATGPRFQEVTVTIVQRDLEDLRDVEFEKTIRGDPS